MAKAFSESKVPSPYLLWLGWVIWLPFLVEGTIGVITARPPLGQFLLTMAVIVTFAGLYLVATGFNAWDLHDMPYERYLATAGQREIVFCFLVVLSVVCALLAHLVGVELLSPFIFTAAYAGGTMRLGKAIVATLIDLAVCLSVGSVVHAADFAQGIFIISVVSFMAFSWVNALHVTRELSLAREELASIAVHSERLRIARDLHDLLGQKLSTIVLKSELARRLISTDPDRAQRETADVEQTARSVLQEVRETVGGYRQPGLPQELQTASEILDAAGIELDLQLDSPVLDSLPKPLENVLAWVVREGTTNVVKHSRAGVCSVKITADNQGWTIQLTDNGRVQPPSDSRGQGLTGLQERAKNLGGWVRSGRRPEGGFELIAFLPRVPA